MDVEIETDISLFLEKQINNLEINLPQTPEETESYLVVISEIALMLQRLIDMEEDVQKMVVYLDFYNRIINLIQQNKDLIQILKKKLNIPEEYHYAYDNIDNINSIIEETPVETLECSICYDDMIVPIDQLKTGGWGKIHRLKSCLHVYCQDCIFTHAKTLILDGNTKFIPCPDYQCECEIPDEEIEWIVGKKLFEKYKKFQSLCELRANPNTRWCPNPECDYGKVWNLEDEKIICDYCSTVYCQNCSLFWHEGKSCQDMLKRNNKKKKKEKKSDKWVKKNSKQCPQCHISIIKQSGCNHMTCNNCRYSFCWVCMEKFDGYEHFESGKCRGKMYFQNPFKKAAVYFAFGTTVVLIGCIAIPVAIVCLPFYGVYRVFR
jgi:hypothetical protein